MNAGLRITTAVVAASLVAVVQAAGPPLEQVGWRRLDLAASKFLLSASTTLTVERVEARTLGPVLRTPPEGTPLGPRGPEVLTLSTESELPFGRRERTVLWLDAASGAALQGHKVVTGRKPYEKLFRYTTEGFFFWRAAPSSGAEERAGPEGWSKRRSRLVRASPALPEGAVVTDSYALLYLASAARLDRPGAGLRVVLLAEEQPVELHFSSGGLVQDRLDYRERGTDGSRRRNQEVLQRVVTVSGQPLGGQGRADEVDLGFLGLRGDVRILLDARSGLPLQLQGRTDRIGELTVTLEAVEWAGPLPVAPARGVGGES